MNSVHYTRCGFATLLAALLFSSAHAAEEGLPLDTGQIEKLTGAKGKFDSEENVFKVSVPRTDLNVTVAGVKMKPPMGLTSWAAFTPAGDHVMVMGDIVVLEEQVNPVMSAALDKGLEVTALHNHFLWDTPKVMFMHIGGLGDSQKLAAAVGKVFERLEETAHGNGGVPRTDLGPGATSLDPEVIQRIIGAAVEKMGDVYRMTLGRTTEMDGHHAGKAMGVNMWAVFADSSKNAIVEGDFAMTESELQGVLKALRGAGIFITSIHNHMVGESPRIIFLHYWGAGPVADLAKAIRAALDTQTGGST